RDNSGSAEAYGGVELEISDYYDYHFYSEANHFASLIDHFQPGWKQEKPIIFGEYCDSDTLRYLAGEKRWWTSRDPDINPQGVRWDMSVLEHEERSKALSLIRPWPEAIALSQRRTAEYRKLIFEQTRLDSRISGYVVTNIIDTPISTAGLLDVDGRSKFEVQDFASVNGDVVLMLERDRRRIWERGGDRPQYIDPFAVLHGASSRFRIIGSNFSPRTLRGTLTVSLRLLSTPDCPMCVERCEVVLQPGRVAEIGLLSCEIPESNGVYSMFLDATLGPTGQTNASEESIAWAHNRWEIWAFPDITIPSEASATNEPGSVAIRYAIDDEVVERYRNGQTTLVVIDRHDPMYTVPGPFWREGVPLIDNTSVFRRIPHRGYAGAQFIGVTPDLSISPESADRIVGEKGRTLIQRIDARTLEEGSYWMEWGNGQTRLIATTLQLEGASGRARRGLAANVFGSFLRQAAID
ncbi:MAG: hypothetical protein KAU31_07110, partial [Spirochaetaceae bacterium]|nr:hypothetical protein [Spirochaetaceae bacterium]